MGHGGGCGKTNPISGSRPLGAVVLMGARAHATGHTAASLRTGLLRQTNPICGRAEGRTSAMWIRSCDEWDTGVAVKKQSQFQKEFQV